MRKGEKIMSDIHFINTDKSDFQNAYFKVMDKRFEEQRKKSIIKGKGELTLEAFLDNEERDCDRAKNILFIYFPLPIIATALAYLYTSLIDGFGRTNHIVYVCVLFILSSVVIFLSFKSSKKSIASRRAWIIAKREEIKAEREKPQAY